MMEKIICLSFRTTLSNGSRQFFERSFPWAIGLIFALMLMVIALGLLAMIIQAASFRWAFPDIFPSSWIFQRPQLYAANLARDVVFNSVVLGLGSTLVSLVLAVASFLFIGAKGHRLLSLWMYIPLILPQIALMMGVQLLLLNADMPPNFLVLIAVHSLFVLPYVYLSLSGAYQRFDWRYVHVAQSLGVGFWSRLWRVILPMTTRPLLSAFALGFSVSMAQYLATLLTSKAVSYTHLTLPTIYPV